MSGAFCALICKSLQRLLRLMRCCRFTKQARWCAGESHQGRGALRDHYLAVFPLDVKSQRFAEGADWGVDGAVSVFCGDVEGFAEGDELDLGDAWRWVVFASGFDGRDVFIDFGEEI